MATSAHRRSSLRGGSSAATDLNNNNRNPEQGTPQRAGQLLSSLAVLPGIGAALLPAVTCPACWPAYAGLLSALGLGFANYTPYLLPLTIVFLAVALGALGYHAIRRHFYSPFVLGLVGSVVLVVGTFALNSDPTLYAGIALLVVASAWNAWPMKTSETCEPVSNNTHRAREE